jgi:antimicrobial peptide system SdpB family protein
MFLTLVGRFVDGQIKGKRPWTNVYGAARSLLAVGTLLTLACNRSATLFITGSGMNFDPPDSQYFIQKIGFFCVFGPHHLEMARWVAVALLAVVASGWNPRLTGLIHWWIASSLQMSATLVDGGDAITANLTLLMLPLTLTDPRRSHWGSADVKDSHPSARLRLFFALIGYVLIRFQMAGVYFHASVAKFGVEEWADGTAIYYWAINPTFGYPDWLQPLTMRLLKDPVIVCCTTWGVMILEYLLGIGLFLPKRHWKWLLYGGITLHVGIIILHGLVSFGLAMIAGLILYLRPLEQVFHFGRKSGEGAFSATAGKLRIAGADRTEEAEGDQVPNGALNEQGK